jgi:hydroxyacylglutathione hydrolase/adenylyltransferase/sulfurtransferase
MDISPQEAAERLAAGQAQLIDVREQYEWDAGRIEGSRHVQLHELAETAMTLDPARPLIFACRVGGRSAMATDAFRQAGFEAVNLSGGLLAWERAGLPFTGHVADH